MVLTGSCMCGQIKYEADAEPAVVAVCHCLNCQKFSGSAFTTNFIVPGSSFKIASGTPKQGNYMADFGYTYRTFFCGDCGSSLYGQPDSMPEMMSIKAGSLDGGAAELKHRQVNAEAFIERRVAYMKPIKDASQVTEMIQP